MSGSSSPINGRYETESLEPAMRLSVRKDLFPDECLLKLAPVTPDRDELEDDISCVKLETDFEQSIDEIANQKMQVANGTLSSSSQPRHRKHKQHSRRGTDHSPVNGYIPSKSKRKKKSHSTVKHRDTVNSSLPMRVKGGKNLNLVSSSECQEEDNEDEEEDSDSDSSDDEVLQFSVKLPLINMQRQTGKPYSHELSQLATRKSKSRDTAKEKRTHTVTPCSGKPRAMMGICSSRSKKKSKKSECTSTYQSQIVDTTNLKIKIRRTSVHEIVTPTPASIADIGQRKSKKKRAASPVASVSSGEEYNPLHGDTAAAMSVAAPKPRHPPPKSRKPTKSRSRAKTEKTERNRGNADRSRGSGSEKVTGPQSPWAHLIPEEVLVKIFEYVVSSQGTLPSVIRLSRVCKLWHNVSCRPDLWKHVDLTQYTNEKCKTDYKLVWLLENRLSKCQSLNIGQWKVCNVPWVLACLVEYCPDLVELSVAGWSRLTPDQLFDLVQGLSNLQRLDLSLTSEMGGSSTCLSAASVARVAEHCGGRLTHLTLANNKFTALPQILASIATHCRNLEVLDISGARATSHPAAVPLEALQQGCPKLRVFRAANAQLVLANPPSTKQSGEGWPQLEELSIAGEAAAERVAVGEYRLGDEALARLVRGALRLRLLDLRGLHRVTDSGLVRVPAWDLQHLFLGGCNVTRQNNSCLELICQKWSHSLLELDLSWASAARILDDAVAALADTAASRLRTLNLCGSSVSLEPVKKVLLKCSNLESINLSSCRALPRGMKRLYTGKELQDLKNSLDPTKAKTKDNDGDEEEDVDKKKRPTKKGESSSRSENYTDAMKNDLTESSDVHLESKSQDKSSPPPFQEPKSVSEKQFSPETVTVSTDRNSKELTSSTSDIRSPQNVIPKILSPTGHSKPDSSSTPRSDTAKTDIRNFHFSPVSKPDSQNQNSPEITQESVKSGNSWSLGQFKTTPTHKSDVNPLNRLESHSKLKHAKTVEQCSPTTSVDNKPSPENMNVKQDIKNPSWNYGNYSPMPRQDSQFSSQRSPYSAQPSPAQPSPYSTQPSPYSTQPSPYSSQPSPYSAQPSPDTSQIVKQDLQKSSSWNTGNFSPMPKQHHTPFSPHPSTHTSPDPGLGMKGDTIRNNSNKTPGKYSPLSRQDRLHSSPYSPRSNVELAFSNKKSPGVGNFSPMMRPDCHLTSPDGTQATRSVMTGRSHDMFGRPVTKAPEIIQNTPSDIAGTWGMDRFNQISNPPSNMESLGWGASAFSTEPVAAPRVDVPNILTTPPPQTWSGLPSFDTSVRRPNDDMSDSWTLGQFRLEPPNQVHSAFLEPNVSFDSLSAHIGLPSQLPQGYLDDGFSETSRVD